jgi:FkbM family methyltransferase
MKMNINKDLAFDVGAYTGDTVSAIRALGFKNIICFEPHPGNYTTLVNNYGSDANIITVQKAVSKNSGELVELVINNDLPWLNTLESIWIYGCRHEPLFSNISKVQVQTISLDDYIRQLCSIPSYIKIDVEGHTIDVLKGLSFKTNMLSFEWVSEFAELNAASLTLVHKLGYDKFVITEHEGNPEGTPLTFESCIKALRDIRMKDSKNEKWGSIWCY